MMHWSHDTDLKAEKNDPIFRDIWWAMESIPGSYTRLNAAKLWQYAKQCSGMMVEIGVDQGRSATVLLHAAEMTGADLTLIDSWESVLVDNWYKVKMLAESFPTVRPLIIKGKSVDSTDLITIPIDLLHIDANHYEGGIDMDCAAWLPRVRPGGIVLFHDYGTTFPAVTAAVDEYTAGWEDLDAWDSLAIRRKP